MYSDAINFWNYLTYLIKLIAPETEIFQGFFETIIIFTPSKFDVKLISYAFPDITNIV